MTDLPNSNQSSPLKDTASREFIQTPLLAPERLLANCRTLIDVGLAGGGIVFGGMLSEYCVMAAHEDWILIARMTWAFVCFSICLLIVGAVAKSISQRSREVVKALLAIFLLSLTTIFIYIASYQRLLYETELRLTFTAMAVWAISGIGLLCVEKRCVAKIHTVTKSQNISLGQAFGRVICIGVILTVFLFTTFHTLACWQLRLGLPRGLQIFADRFQTISIHLPLAIISVVIGICYWISICKYHRDRLYPENFETVPHLSVCAQTVPVICA